MCSMLNFSRLPARVADKAGVMCGYLVLKLLQYGLLFF